MQVGLQLLPLDDSRLFITLSLTRGVLELGNPEMYVPPAGCLSLVVIGADGLYVAPDAVFWSALNRH